MIIARAVPGFLLCGAAWGRAKGMGAKRRHTYLTWGPVGASWGGRAEGTAVPHPASAAHGSMCLAVTTHRHKLDMALQPTSNSRRTRNTINQTHATAQTRSSVCLYGLQLMSNVVFRCVCLLVCVALGPKAAISGGEQNHYGWRRPTLVTARLIKFYGGLRLMKSAAAYGSG